MGIEREKNLIYQILSSLEDDIFGRSLLSLEELEYSINYFLLWDKTEDEMVGRHHQLNEHEFEQALGDCKDREACRAADHGVTKSQT